MKYEKFVKERPKGFILIFIVLFITGLFAFYNIPKEDLPSVEYPRLTVSAYWGKQSPENVTKYVASVIESEIYMLDGIKKITSYSYTGYLTISIELFKESDPNFVTFLINEKLSRIKKKLPADVSGPYVFPYVPRNIGDDTFFSFYLYSDTLSSYKLAQFADNTLQRDLASVPGVGNIEVLGKVKRTLCIEYDPEAIIRYNIPFYLVKEKIMNANRKFSVGYIENDGKRYYITFKNKVSLDDVKNWVIKDGIKISQVAKVYFKDEEGNSIHRINGKPAVYVVLTKARKSNAIVVSNSVLKKLEEVMKKYPFVKYIVADNEGKEVLKGYKSVSLKMIISIIAIFLVLFSFMRHIKPSLITMASILLSVAVTINYLFFSGSTLNKFTMSGIVLAFGLLVDNAVVVYENIHKHFFNGKSIKESISLSFHEMFVPVIASTLTTICALIPFIFLQPELKIYYIPFAKTVIISLIASIFVSFSLVPIAFSYLHMETKVKKLKKSKFLLWYKKLIKGILKYRFFVMVIVLIIFGYSLDVFIMDVDKSNFSWGGAEYPPEIYCYFNSEPNVPDFRLKNAILQFEGLIKGNSTVKYYRTYVSTNSGRIIVYFKKPYIRSAEAYALREKLKIYGNRMSQVNVRVWGIGPDFGGGYGGGISYDTTVYLHGYDYEKLKAVAHQFSNALERFREVSNVKLGVDSTKSVRKVNILLNNKKLKIFGLSARFVANKIAYLISESKYPNAIKYGNSYISLDFKLKHKLSLYELKKLYLVNGIKLSDVADILISGSTTYIKRENQMYEYPISFDYNGGYEDKESFFKTIKEKITLPLGFSLITQKRYSWWNDDRDYSRIFSLLIFAILIIYMIIASLYESYSEPFIILTALPLAFIGVIWIYYLFELNFGVHAIMGTMLLSGIVVNNSIIMVNHINYLRREKRMKRILAIVTGASDRLRPILITSLTTIIGLLPIILLKEKDESSTAKIWKHLSYATVGGLSSSTVFVLLIMPLLYFFFSRRDKNEKNYPDSGVFRFVKRNFLCIFSRKCRKKMISHIKKIYAKIKKVFIRKKAVNGDE